MYFNLVDILFGRGVIEFELGLGGGDEMYFNMGGRGV